ncbi:MAG: PTS ascorbate transporter subunit IIC [Lachnoclostridium sp.]|jgi:PTS system ascorbate-specific IIC component|nr:PTS ascorbate transporter subunit IIC [Lachnoclostridium sp.]
MAIIDVLIDVLSTASILVGFMVLVGLVLQRRKISEVLSGTLKAIIGFLIFGAGGGLAGAALGDFQGWFSEGFGLEGVLPLSEAVTALAQERFGTVISLIMVLGFVVNLIIARITPFKYIFLTGQHNLFLAALLTCALKSLGLGNPATILAGAVLLGICAAVYPAIAQKWMRKVTGNDDIAIGHYCTLTYALSGWLGSKVGKPEQSTEKLNLPGWLSIFKDYVISISVSVGIFFFIAAIAAGPTAVGETSGGMNWIIYPFIQALTFAGGVYVILTGVRMMLNELVPAFVGISEKLIPNAKPALDCPVVFQYAPVATVIGFISAYIGGLLCMLVFALLSMPVIIPVAIPYFFIGATAGVFGNATGGWKGAITGGFVTGIIIAVGPALIYPIMDAIGLAGSSFPEPDFVLIGVLIYYFGKVFGISGTV